MSKLEVTWKKLAAASAVSRREIVRVLGEAQRLATSKDVDAISACAALETELAAWLKDGPAFANQARQLLTQLDVDRGVQTEAFEQRLSRELQGSGYSVFGEKSLLVVDGIVHVQVELSARRIRINDLLVDEMEPKVVCVRIEEEVARVKRLITSPSDFLKSILDAYDREIRGTLAVMGSPVHATALAFQVALQRQTPRFRTDPAARYYREYPLTQFRADLYTLLASRKNSINGRTLHCVPGADTSGSVFMLVPAVERMAHVGRIWFQAPESASQ